MTALIKALAAAADHGATTITVPYEQGNLRIATNDPAGNVIRIRRRGLADLLGVHNR